MSSSPTPYIASSNATPIWSNHRAIFDRMKVEVGNPDTQAWPGGGYLGVTSAITGVVRVPLEADQSFDGANPTNIFHAGVMGLVQTDAHNQAAVGVVGMARPSVDQGRVWGGNFIASNLKEADGTRKPGVHCQINGVEIDCGWWQPTTPVGGSNMLGLWIPAEFYGGRPDGRTAAIMVGRFADYGWKQMLVSDHGGADTFAEVGMIKGPNVAGPSGAQPMHFIASNGGQAGNGPDTNDYRHSFLSVAPSGDFIVQPNYYGTPGSLIVGNSNLNQASRISPTDGFIGPKASVTTLEVFGNGVVNGTLTSGNSATGNLTAANATVNGTLNSTAITTNAFTSNGNANVTGNLTAGNALYAPNFFFFKGVAVELSAPGSIPPTHKALIIRA